jgi:Gas vesicle synthesis protein GvpL/GvpF
VRFPGPRLSGVVLAGAAADGARGGRRELACQQSSAFRAARRARNSAPSAELASHVRPRETDGASRSAAKGADVRRRKGIYVYGILPADIEVAADVPGVGEHPGLLRDVRIDGLAALISEVDLSEQLGSPEDLRTYREILDSIAAEVPVLPMRFGTVPTSEDAVAEELLGANHDEFTAALERLEGRACALASASERASLLAVS